jgi:opacity protein-like surface antigen
MRNLLLGAVLALALVACTAAATVYVTQEDHDADIFALERRIRDLEDAVFAPPLDAPPYTFDNGAPR